MGGEASGCDADDHRGVHRGGAVRSASAPPPPAAGSASSPTRATASSAASIPSRADWGAEVATRLILELCGGEASQLGQRRRACRNGSGSIALRPERVAALGGSTCRRRKPRASSRPRLRPCGEERPAPASTPPSWRADIEGEADLVEEVAAHPRLRQRSPPCRCQRRRARCRSPRSRRRSAACTISSAVLASRGLMEAVTFSFMRTASPSSVRRRQQAAGAARQPDRRRSRRHAAVDPAEPAAGRRAQCRPRPRRSPRCSRSARNTATTRPTGQALVAAGLRTGNTTPRHWAATAARRRCVRRQGAMRWRCCGPRRAGRRTCRSPPMRRPGITPAARGALRLGPTVLALFGEMHPRVLTALDVEGRRPSASRCSSTACRSPRPRARAPTARPLLQGLALPAGRARLRLRGRRRRAGREADARRQGRRQGADRRRSRCSTSSRAAACREGKKSLALSVTLQPPDRHADRRRRSTPPAEDRRRRHQGHGRHAQELS